MAHSFSGREIEGGRGVMLTDWISNSCIDSSEDMKDHVFETQSHSHVVIAA